MAGVRSIVDRRTAAKRHARKRASGCPWKRLGDEVRTFLTA